MAIQLLHPRDILEQPLPGSKFPRRPAPPAGKQLMRSAKLAKASGFGKGVTSRPEQSAKGPAGVREVYAGSGFTNSPAPSALPLPRFSLKKDEPGEGDCLATTALRRMLRLE